MTSTDDNQKQISETQALARLLPALAHDGGEPGRRARAALAGMTARICGRYPAEIRAVAAAAAATEPEPASLSHAAGLLAFRAGADARFASGFLPWLAAAQMLVIPDIGEDGAVSNQSVTGRPFDPAMTPSARLPGSRGGVAAMAQ